MSVLQPLLPLLVPGAIAAYLIARSQSWQSRASDGEAPALLWSPREESAGGRDKASAMQQYVVEYLRAVHRTQTLGVELPLENGAHPEPAITSEVVETVQKVLENFRPEEITMKTVDLNLQLIRFLHDRFRLRLTLTAGWVEVAGKRAFFHDSEYLERLLTGETVEDHREGLHFHFWLTASNMDIIDVSLSSVIPLTSGKRTNRVLCWPNDSAGPVVAYHPTVVGSSFLEKLQVIFEGAQHELRDENDPES